MPFGTPWTREIRPRLVAAAATDLLASLAPATLGLTSVSVVLGLLVPGAALRDPRIAPLDRAELAATELLALFGLVLLLGGVRAAARHGCSRLGAGPRARLLSKAVLGAAIAGALFLHLSSWGLFWGIGSFLDAEVLRFATLHPDQMARHVLAMNPLVTAGAIAAAGAIGAAAVLARPASAARLAPSLRPALALSLGLAALASAGLALAGELRAAERSAVVVDDAGQRVAAGRHWSTARAERSGPVAHLLASVGRPASLGAALRLPDASAAPGLALEPRPRVDLDAWARASPSRPTSNVIVLLVESLRPDVLRRFGGPREVMPALDALAAESLRFRRTYAQASHSDYADLCPLSSQYPLREPEHHFYPSPLPYPRALLYDLLKGFGYRTAIVSSQNESWGNMHNYLSSERLDLLLDSRSRAAEATVDAEDTIFAWWTSRFGLAGKLDDRVTVAEAIRWIGSSDRPFFLYVNLQNSHFPYRLPPGFAPRFSPHVVDFPFAFASYPAEKVPIVRNRYDNSLAYVDAQIATLVEFLRRTGRLDRTILVVSGDTGQGFMEHGVSAHAGPLYEEVVRVPLLVRAPGLAPGDVDELVEHVDVPPTVLGLLGLPPFPGFQGRDVLAHGSDGHAFLVVQSPMANQLAVVAERFKLIYDVRERRYLLFDVQADPAERTDLSAREPARVRELAGRLQAWVDAQLGYYGPQGRRAAFFPPVLLPERAGPGAVLNR
jgi:arylsulfatase A-like enzyme